MNQYFDQLKTFSGNISKLLLVVPWYYPQHLRMKFSVLAQYTFKECNVIDDIQSLSTLYKTKIDIHRRTNVLFVDFGAMALRMLLLSFRRNKQNVTLSNAKGSAWSEEQGIEYRAYKYAKKNGLDREYAARHLPLIEMAKFRDMVKKCIRNNTIDAVEIIGGGSVSNETLDFVIQAIDNSSIPVRRTFDPFKAIVRGAAEYAYADMSQIKTEHNVHNLYATFKDARVQFRGPAFDTLNIISFSNADQSEITITTDPEKIPPGTSPDIVSFKLKNLTKYFSESDQLSMALLVKDEYPYVLLINVCSLTHCYDAKFKYMSSPYLELLDAFAGSIRNTLTSLFNEDNDLDIDLDTVKAVNETGFATLFKDLDLDL